VIDNRTGKSIEIPIEHSGFIQAHEFKKLTVDNSDVKGITIFDPSFSNTAGTHPQTTMPKKLTFSLFDFCDKFFLFFVCFCFSNV